MTSVAQLPELIHALPAELREVCHRLFYVERAIGCTLPPPAMRDWIAKTFGTLDCVERQAVVRVINHYTLDSAVFNPLRGRRPLGTKLQRDQRDALLTEAVNTQSSYMFADPQNLTTADTFGRIRGTHCVTASNVAKFDGWHGLVIFDEPHPLRFTWEQFVDYLYVALCWLVSAHQADPEARYPLITWNSLWKAGASITHGHMQLSLSRGMAAGHIERLRRVITDYRAQHNASYRDDVWRVHDSLGLSFYDDDTIHGYTSLTPFKDRQLTFTTTQPLPHLEYQPSSAVSTGGTTPMTPHMCNSPDTHTTTELSGGLSEWNIATLHDALVPLWYGVYRSLRNLIEVQGVQSFNMAVYLPPFGDPPEPWEDRAVWVHLVDRGDPFSRMVNIGAMEVFASSIITIDPYDVVNYLRETT